MPDSEPDSNKHSLPASGGSSKATTDSLSEEVCNDVVLTILCIMAHMILSGYLNRK
eukprot:XP_001706345.1 Hypothetical protein GL50803_5894 [Giardia lamblia ATCC 50803]